MLIRNAKAEWQGDLLHGNGQLSVGSGALDVPYSVKSRLEDGQSATNPEERSARPMPGALQWRWPRSFLALVSRPLIFKRGQAWPSKRSVRLLPSHGSNSKRRRTFRASMMRHSRNTPPTPKRIARSRRPWPA